MSPARAAIPSCSRRQFIRSFDAIDGSDFDGSGDEWCDGCNLPLESCCCPESSELGDELQ